MDEWTKENYIDNYTAACERIANHYGWRNQFTKAIEEMAELTQALCKNDKAQIIEELGDVYIMLSQIEIIIDENEKLYDTMEAKLKRQLKRMNGSIDCQGK